MVSVDTWRHEEKTGADCSGISGAANRTLGLGYANAQIAGMQVIVAGSILQYNTHFTLSSNIITFITNVWDGQAITIDYITTDSGTAGSEYTDTLGVVRTAGVGVPVTDENVGTGDNSATSFDLDNGNVIAGSYSLYHAASDSNNMNVLTETTHYTLDKDAGRIELTSAGVTALGTDILYAKYTHSPKISDTILDSWLDRASREVDRMTENVWTTSSSYTEFFDGYSDDYPKTEGPYSNNDTWERKPSVTLSKKNVENNGSFTLSGVYFLKRNAGLSSVMSYDSVAGTYTTVTTDANSPAGDSFQPFATTTAADDYLYIGSAYQFNGLTLNLFTNGVTTGTNTIEYYNSSTSSWTAFTPTESTTGVLDFEASGSLSWSNLAGWGKVSVNSSSEYYYVRIKAGGTYSTEASINNIFMDQDFVIDKNLPLYTVDISKNGRITFLQDDLPNGVRNVRVDYNFGYSQVPELIKELTELVMGLRVYANITGGSYDDATMFTLGRKTISIGEVYVNVAEVVRQFRSRIKEIINAVGIKMAVV